MTEQVHGTRMERVAESAFARIMNRLGTPVLIAALGFFFMREIKNSDESTAELRAEMKEQGASLARQETSLSEIRSDVRDLNTRLEYSVISSVQNLERRVDRIEQGTRTP
jgi:hypothetical protein